ncbi:Na(+)/H(+) antiporter NhaB [Bienertia sinuspersici]
MYVNTNPFLVFFVINSPIYDQHLLEPFLNESISTENLWVLQ